MNKKETFQLNPERQRKTRVLHSQNSHEKITKRAASRRGSMDICVSPVVSLKKRGSIRNRSRSEFFGSMRKRSSISDKRNSNPNVEIVTPFAQILAKLNSVLQYMVHEVSNQNLDKNEDGSTPSLAFDQEVKIDLMRLRIGTRNGKGTNDAFDDQRVNALEDLVWCLEQLKQLETSKLLRHF